MSHQNRPLPAVPCLRIWAIWGLLGGLALSVHGFVHPPFPDTLEGQGGPPAIDLSASPSPSQVKQFFAAPGPPGDMPEPVMLDTTKIPMKAVSLDYLKRQLQTVRSQLDLIRIFADGELKDVEELAGTGRVARTPRSAHSSNQEITLIKAELAGQQAQIQLPDFASHVDDPKYMEALKGIAYDDEENYQADEPEPNFEAFESALHHIDEMNSCSSVQCKDPKPFVHFMKDPRDRNRVFFPQCTVLHRCMNFTGCCGESGECVPKQMTVIFKAFFVVNRADGREGYVEYNPSMATMIPLINHTACECRERPRLPKCTKNCPIPFRLMREGYNCTCNCYVKAYEDHWQCEGVKEGVVQLSQDGLICIKEGLCYPPQCVVGEFDVKKGYCPLSDKYSLKAYHFENPEDRRHYRQHLKHFKFTGSSPSRRPRIQYMSAYPDHNTKGKRKGPLLPKPLRQALVNHLQKTKLHQKGVSARRRKNVSQRKVNSRNVATRKSFTRQRVRTPKRTSNPSIKSTKRRFTHDSSTKLEPSSKPRTATNRSQIPAEKNTAGDRLGTSRSEASGNTETFRERQHVTVETTTRETRVRSFEHSENNLRSMKHSVHPNKHRHHEHGKRHRHHNVPSSLSQPQEPRQSASRERKYSSTQRAFSSSREAPVQTKSTSKVEISTIGSTSTSTTQRVLTSEARRKAKATSRRTTAIRTSTDPSARQVKSTPLIPRAGNSPSPPIYTSTSQRPEVPTTYNKEISGKDFYEVSKTQNKDESQHNEISTTQYGSTTISQHENVTTTDHKKTITSQHGHVTITQHIDTTRPQEKGISATQFKDTNVSRHRDISTTRNNDVFTQHGATGSTAAPLESSSISELKSSVTRQSSTRRTHTTVSPVLQFTHTSSLFNTPTTKTPKFKKRPPSKSEKMGAMYPDDMPDMETEEEWMSDFNSDSFMEDGSGENIERDD